MGRESLRFLGDCGQGKELIRRFASTAGGVAFGDQRAHRFVRLGAVLVADLGNRRAIFTVDLLGGGIENPMIVHLLGVVVRCAVCAPLDGGIAVFYRVTVGGHDDGAKQIGAEQLDAQLLKTGEGLGVGVSVAVALAAGDHAPFRGDRLHECLGRGGGGAVVSQFQHVSRQGHARIQNLAFAGAFGIACENESGLAVGEGEYRGVIVEIVILLLAGGEEGKIQRLAVQDGLACRRNMEGDLLFGNRFQEPFIGLGGGIGIGHPNLAHFKGGEHRRHAADVVGVRVGGNYVIQGVMSASGDIIGDVIGILGFGGIDEHGLSVGELDENGVALSNVQKGHGKSLAVSRDGEVSAAVGGGGGEEAASRQGEQDGGEKDEG